MPDWVNTATWWLVILTGITIVVKVLWWLFGLDADRKQLKNDAAADRKTATGFMEEIRDSIGNVREQIGNIREQISNIFGLLNKPYTHGSPMRLSEYGKQLADNLSAPEWSREVASGILGEVRGMKAFQVHEFCKNYAKNKLDVETHPEMFSRSYRHGITDEDMRTVLTLVLRDELLSQLGIEDDS